MDSTYDHAEPGVIFFRSHQRGQQPLLLRDDRIDQPLRRTALARLRLLLPRQHQSRRCFVIDPFTPKARFDFEAFGKVVRPSVRMLDNVLDVTGLAAAAAARRRR